MFRGRQRDRGQRLEDDVRGLDVAVEEGGTAQRRFRVTMRQRGSDVARHLERRLERPARRRAHALDEGLLLQVTFEVLAGDAR